MPRKKAPNLPPNGLIFLHMKLFRDKKGTLPNSANGTFMAPKGIAWGSLLIRLKEERGLTPTTLYKQYDPTYERITGKRKRPLPSDDLIYTKMRDVKNATGHLPKHNTPNETAPKNWSWNGLFNRLKTDRQLNPIEFYQTFEPDYQPPERKYLRKPPQSKPTTISGVDIYAAYSALSRSITQDNKVPDLKEYDPIFSETQRHQTAGFFQSPVDPDLLPQNSREFIFALGLADRFGEINIQLVGRKSPVERPIPFEPISKERADKLRMLKMWERQNAKLCFAPQS